MHEADHKVCTIWNMFRPSVSMTTKLPLDNMAVEGSSSREDPGVTWEEGERLDYRTVAKAGGRKDLLYHIEKSRDLKVEAVTWPRKVDWFEHHTTFQPKPGPYKSPLKDHWSQWKTDVVRLPQLEQHPYPVDDSTPRRRGKATTVPVSNREGVDFGRLLALDYQREWLQKREEKESRRRLVAKERREKQRRQLEDHTHRSRQSLAPALAPRSQPFVMKRFENVPAKVKLPPI